MADPNWSSQYPALSMCLSVYAPESSATHELRGIV